MLYDVVFLITMFKQSLNKNAFQRVYLVTLIKHLFFVTLTLTQWPRYMNSTLDIPKMYPHT